VPSQSPVYVPPPLALYEGPVRKENRFRTKVVVSHLNSVGEFYIQIDKAQETYANLTRQLDVHVSLLLEQLNQVDMKTIGLICAANVDGHWNRCRIVDIVDDKTVTLFLTDVGQKIKVDCAQLYRLSHPRE
jgi:hypothetical protein